MTFSSIIGWLFIMLAIGFVVWMSYLRGFYLGSQKSIEIYELGKRDGERVGVEQGMRVMAETSAVEMVRYAKRVLDILGIPDEMQKVAMDSATRAMEEEVTLERMWEGGEEDRMIG